MYHIIEVVNNWNEYCTKGKAAMPKYEYPPYVATAAMLNKLSKYGVPFKASASEIYRVRELDAMKSVLTDRSKSKTAIFGDGYLLSEAKGEEMMQCRAKVLEAKIERQAQAEMRAQAEHIVWQLSDREMEIIKRLGGTSGSEQPSSEQD